MPPRLWVLLCRWTPPYPGGDPRNVSRCSAGAQCLGPHLALCTASFGALKDKGANNFVILRFDDCLVMRLPVSRGSRKRGETAPKPLLLLSPFTSLSSLGRFTKGEDTGLSGRCQGVSIFRQSFKLTMHPKFTFQVSK
eukprot:1151952-Pelagomonas_calceolata.AAC.4